MAAIRRCTRELIHTANKVQEQPDGSTESTSPQDLAAVRSLGPPRQALLRAVDEALAAGVDRVAIRRLGIGNIVDETTVVTEFAHFVVHQVQLTIQADGSGFGGGRETTRGVGKTV